jgi:transposase-like protein
MPKPIALLPNQQVTPEPALEKRSRRIFTADYKLRILAEADQCRRGELGGLLRREKLYSSQLGQWRRELSTQGVDGLSATKPGPRPRKTEEERRIEQLEKENARLQRRLSIATDCIDLQKKALSMLEQSNTGSDV